MKQSKHEEESQFTITRRSHNDDDGAQASKLIITRTSESNKDDEVDFEICPLCLSRVTSNAYLHHVQCCLENMDIEPPQQEQKMMNDDDGRDFDALNSALMSEAIGTNTNTLNWDCIAFISSEEKEGSKQLQNELQTKRNTILAKLPPFEMARFYIGSKCRIPKAVAKWMATKAFYSKYNLQSFTQQQMMTCFQEMSRFLRFGGTDNEGRSIMTVKVSLWFPANFEGNEVVMRCFLMIYNKFTENLYCARRGMVVIFDCVNVGLSNFDVNLVRMWIRIMQDIYPLRFGGFYMLNLSKFAEICIQIVKPFMSQKFQERIIPITTKELFTVVARNQCPDLVEGGTYNDHKLDPMYEGCVRYMRRSNMDCFAS